MHASAAFLLSAFGTRPENMDLIITELILEYIYSTVYVCVCMCVCVDLQIALFYLKNIVFI